MDIVHSDVLTFELANNPHGARREFALRMLAKASKYVKLSAALENRAKRFTEASIQPLDALHLASAIESTADYFCSCDDQLLKAARRVDT